MTDPVREGFAALQRTLAYIEWATLTPGNGVDAGKLASKLAGVKTPKPRSGYALALWRILDALHPSPVPPVPGRKELLGFIRDVSHADAQSSFGEAFREAGGSRVLLQFAAENDIRNRAAIPLWRTQYEVRGIAVDGWWRVNHYAPNSHPVVTGIPGWWANAEDPSEVARLPAIYAAGGITGPVVLGKAHGVTLDPGMPIAIECFREKPTSDATVTNSVRFWLASGVPLKDIIVMLQGYGTPFSPAADQAREAVSLGVTRLAFYPLDGFTPAEIKAVGKILFG